jgi:alcohol dehydrogenase
LRKRGKHVQVGLMLADHCHPVVPMDKIIANELEIIGSHGMQAYKYWALLEMIQAGKLQPEKLIQKTISLDESLEKLTEMDSFGSIGVTVINEFS